MPGYYEQLEADTSLNVGGKTAITVFICMLVGFVVESELAQYVQSRLDYRHPYFLFYIAHSSLLIILPIHLALLRSSTGLSPATYIRGLENAIRYQFGQKPTDVPTDKQRHPITRFLRLVSLCTIGITIPGLLWFAAVTLASVSDVTAIWNSNAFWAYVLSVKLQKLHWESIRLTSVLIASVGVLAVVYGSGSSTSTPADSLDTTQSVEVSTPAKSTGPSAPLLGNFLTLIASLGYALYQVLYNKYATLHDTATREVTESQRRLSISSDSESVTSDEFSTPLEAGDKDLSHPPPFGLYANLITSSMGLVTSIVLWIPLPFLHIFGIETFALPSDPWLLLCVLGIALSAVMFNMCFMILLGLWGPIITSVGNLLTIVLILIIDIIFRNAINTLTTWSFLGSGMIVCAFAVLAYDTFKKA